MRVQGSRPRWPFQREDRVEQFWPSITEDLAWSTQVDLVRWATQTDFHWVGGAAIWVGGAAIGFGPYEPPFDPFGRGPAISR